MSVAHRCILPLLLWLFFLQAATQAEEVRLFLLHTNDIHGHLEPTEGGTASAGYVRLATVVRTLKATFPGQVVLLDAGDMALGTPTSGLFFGVPTAESMRSLGYDAVAIGNHEFNWGKEAMAAMLAATGAPALCANLVNLGDGSHPYPASTVIERSGARLGVIGLVAPDTATRAPRSYTEGWQFLAAEPAAQGAIAELPQVDAVIALTHIGLPADRSLARAVPGIDLIVGGHSHTPLAEVVMENGVPIVQTGAYSRFLGVLELLIDTAENRLEVVSYRLVPIDGAIPPDPEVAAIVESYAARVRPILDRIAASASANITNEPAADSVDTPLGNLIADMLKAEAGTDLALYNRGGVRGHMPAGPITVRALHEMFPFDDPVVILEVSAAQLQEIIEEGAHTQAKLSVSDNLRVKFNGESGGVEITIAGKPLQREKTYTLATTNFLATGGDQMSSLPSSEVKVMLSFTRDVVESYLKRHRAPLAPPAPNRVVVRQ